MVFSIKKKMVSICVSVSGVSFGISFHQLAFHQEGLNAPETF